MKLFILFSAVFGAALAQLINEDYARCQQDPIPIFRREVLLPFTQSVASEASLYSGDHFIISPHTIWLSLAAVAENSYYANEGDRNLLWESLYFPNAKCVRDQIYQLALNLEYGNEFLRNRALAIDNHLAINRDWQAFSDSTGIIKYLPVPYDVESFGRVQQYMGIEPRIPLSGNSVFLDRLDWGSLWSSAFIDETTTQGPFYNAQGKEIAQVEYLRMRTRARFADIPGYDVRALALPVGYDGRYTMVLAVGAEPKTLIEAVFSRDILSELSLTEEPIDVVIPRLSMRSGLDLRPALSNIGLGSVFGDEQVTSYISEPSALPMGYLQRVDVNITGSLATEPTEPIFVELLEEISDSITEFLYRFNNNVEEDHYHFIANRPFLFSLYETNYQVPVFTGVYSYPGRRGQQEQFAINGIL